MDKNCKGNICVNMQKQLGPFGFVSAKKIRPKRNMLKTGIKIMFAHFVRMVNAFCNIKKTNLFHRKCEARN